MPSGWSPLATMVGWVVIVVSVGLAVRECVLALRRERRAREAHQPDQARRPDKTE